MTNEAAERLLAEIEGFRGRLGWLATSSGFSAVDAPAMIDAALAAERRATVERIRVRSIAHNEGGYIHLTKLAAILREEAK